MLGGGTTHSRVQEMEVVACCKDRKKTGITSLQSMEERVTQEASIAIVWSQTRLDG